jgi:hypothetical protein
MLLVPLEKFDYQTKIDTKITRNDLADLYSMGLTFEPIKNDDKAIEVLTKIYNTYGIKPETKHKTNSTFEMFKVAYIMPHFDLEDLNENPNTNLYQEGQCLFPFELSSDGYVVYAYDFKKKSIEAHTCELNKAFLLDQSQVHFGLPEILNKSEEDLLKKVLKRLNTYKSKNDFEENLGSTDLQKIIHQEKTHNPTIRWGEPAKTTFLTGRVYVPKKLFEKGIVFKNFSKKKNQIKLKAGI